MPPEALSPRRSGATVSIGCKLPSGLVLELDTVSMIATPLTGGKEVPIHTPSGQKVEIIGANAGNPDSPQKRFLDDGSARISFGCGITEINAEFWETWATQHKGFPPLENGMIFVVPNTKDAAVEAKSRANVKTGLEGLDPDRPAPGITRDTGRAI